MLCRTLFPLMSAYITIEDAAELQLQQPHVGRLETRPANAEGKGEIRQRELVKNALRMRPDRIIVGECRGEEAFDMLQAMNTGHEGSMTTIHANSPRDALKRLEQMVAMAGHRNESQQHSKYNRVSNKSYCPAPETSRWEAAGNEHLRNYRDGRRGYPDAGNLSVR